MNIRFIPILAATLLLAVAMPVTAEDDYVGGGDILIGDILSPTTRIFGIDGVDGLTLDVTGFVGRTVYTVTSDPTETGYDLDLYFYDAEFNLLSSCATEAADETCVVPAGAAWMDVAAFFGVLLHVDVKAIAVAA